MNLVIFGPQGSGKGTQAKKLCAKYGLVHVETGQIFREIAKEDSELGRFIHSLNEKKEMIPDDITAAVLLENLKDIPSRSGIILDSAPRTSGQIEPVERMLKSLGRSIDRAIYITLPREKSIERINRRYTCIRCRTQFELGKEIKNLDDHCPLCGGIVAQRIDDTPDGIAKRLDTFREVTIPVVEHYRKEGKLVEVDGEQDVEKVFEEITEKLD